MKLLVTGATGFIGSYFINNYEKLYHIESFSFRINSLDKLNTSPFDAIIHLSALVHQMKGAPAEAYKKVNIDQTLELAHKAKKEGVKHFIFMSTVKVYGEESEKPYTENTTCKPSDEYGKSKLIAENKLLKLQSEDFTISIIRTPIVYGPQVKGNIQSLLKMISRLPIIPLGGIHNKRSMIYVGNLCYSIDQIIKYNKTGIYLVQDDEILSTSSLIKYISIALKKKNLVIKIPGLETLLKFILPFFHKRLFQNLYLNNEITVKKLSLNLPYPTTQAMNYLISDEK